MNFKFFKKNFKFILLLIVLILLVCMYFFRSKIIEGNADDDFFQIPPGEYLLDSKSGFIKQGDNKIMKTRGGNRFLLVEPNNFLIYTDARFSIEKNDKGDSTLKETDIGKMLLLPNTKIDGTKIIITEE